MPRRIAFALALLSALTGCASPPRGPLVEYRDGLTPITRPVKRDGSYALRSADPCGQPLTELKVAKCARIGFSRDEHGFVSAVAPAYTLPLSSGACYWWEAVPGPV